MDFSTALTLVQTILQLLNTSIPFQREIKYLWGYKSQLEKLEQSIKIIRGVLLEAETLQRQQLRITIPLEATLERLNMVLYDADDLFDEVATLVHRKNLMSGNNVSKELSLFFSRFNQLLYAFTKCRDIKKIEETLDDIGSAYRKFGSMVSHQGGGETSQATSKARETGSMLCDKDVIIGRDDDKRVVINMLLDDPIEESVSCVSIVGIGGLGKTTLAQLVYNDEMIKREFEPRMWVCVSNDFDLNALLGEILAVVTNQSKQGGLSMDQLQTKIQQELHGKKYLLVLDDVWGDIGEKWEKLRRPLIGGGSRGSRILVTTRSANMTDIVGGQTHELKGLSEEESWNLFERMTFKTRQEMEALNGEKILNKCAAIPLAIRVIGSSLRGRGENKWMNVGSTNIANEIDEGIIPVLKMSYYDLPLHLKRCFTYCAMFPKDYKIVKEDLIYLWMAQGFIKPNGPSLEDVGEEYFMDLLARCFFQDVKRADDGEIVSCKMHDLIHDLAKTIAGNEVMSVNDTKDLKAAACHVFITERVAIRSQFRRIRTLLKRESFCSYRFIKISKVRNLRVLSLPNSFSKKVPNMVGELIHLRYVDLSRNSFRSLPSSITNLFNLQTLKLRDCLDLESLPKDFVKLVNLRYLDLLNCYKLENMPPRLCSMTCLRKLTRFVLGNNRRDEANFSGHVSGLEDLRCLKSLTDTLQIKLQGGSMYDVAKVEGAYILEMEQLKRIEIDFCCMENNAKTLFESLQPSYHLQMLKLISYPEVEFPSWGMRGGLLKNLEFFLPNLVEFSLHECFKLERLPSMSQLPKLKVLRLDNLSSLEYVESNSDGNGDPMEHGCSRQGEASELVFFPSLQILELNELPRLKGWESCSNPCAFPQLNELRIQSCNKLTTFPLCSKVRIVKIKCPDTEKLLFYGKSMCDVEITSVNVGFIVNRLPADILQHHTCLKIMNSNDIKRLLTLEVFQNGMVLNILSLEVSKCKKMKRLSELLGEIRRHLTTLETLKLNWLPELELECEEEDDSSSSREGKIREEDNNVSALEMPWRFLAPTLRHLVLWGLSKLVKLPRGMHRLISLQSLRICFCVNFEELPDWIGCFTSLKSLNIFTNSKLNSLPQEICLLTSLQYLHLNCISKELKRRCNKPHGVDWTKIQHIPNIIINDKSVQ